MIYYFHYHTSPEPMPKTTFMFRKDIEMMLFLTLHNFLEALSSESRWELFWMAAGCIPPHINYLCVGLFEQREGAGSRRGLFRPEVIA